MAPSPVPVIDGTRGRGLSCCAPAGGAKRTKPPSISRKFFMIIPFVKRLQQIQRHREYDRRSRSGQSLDAQRMKKFIRLICMLLVTACSIHRQKLTWRVKDV